MREKSVKGRFRIGYDKNGVPVLLSKCHLFYLYLLQAHEVDHGGINNMILRSRSQVWNMQGARVATKIKKTQMF
jgi:hypothetical protein